MTIPTCARAALFCVVGLLSVPAQTAAVESHVTSSQEVVKLWPTKPPGADTASVKEEAKDTHVPDAGRVVHVITNVTEPTFTVVRSATGKASGAGMIVLPGGGFGALAWDLEGTEVARWLADRGVTAFVLKYRVGGVDPALQAKVAEIFSKQLTPEERFEQFMEVIEPRRRIAVEDAAQALRIIRANASEYGVAADRIGMMGFSAGAMTTMGVVLESDAETRPNFAAPIYGAMPPRPVPKDGPPLFIVSAADDHTVAAAKSTAMFEAWQRAGLPVELHIYESGGHGFGLGKPGTATTRWTEAFADWLTSHHLMAGPKSDQAQ